MNIIPEVAHEKKRFLKKLTEPKYHKTVIGMIEAK